MNIKFSKEEVKDIHEIMWLYDNGKVDPNTDYVTLKSAIFKIQPLQSELTKVKEENERLKNSLRKRQRLLESNDVRCCETCIDYMVESKNCGVAFGDGCVNWESKK